MLKRSFTALALAACMAPMLAWAQAWPTKQPIKIIAVFPPGGSVDQVARILAQSLSQQLGQSVVVENKAGASGVVGTQAMATAPADGYTWAMVFDTHGVNSSLIANMPYDSKKDLVPLILVGTSAMLLATHVGSEYKSFADVVAAAKAQKTVSFGTVGNGSLGHLSMALLGKSANLTFNHIPFKGGGPAIADTAAGHTQLQLGSIPTVIGQVRAKRLKAIAVGGPKPHPSLPGLPTISESGVPGYVSQIWFGVFAPKATPAAIISAMHGGVGAALDNADTVKRLNEQGVDINKMSSAEFGKLMASEQDKWAKVIKAANITGE